MGSLLRMTARKADGTIELTLGLSKGLLLSLTVAVIGLIAFGYAVMPAQSQQASGRAKKAIPGTSKNYSAAIEAGDYVFLSGTLGTKGGKPVEGGIKPETGQALENLKETLAKSGLGMGDVVKVTVFIKNLEDFQPMNDVYRTYFPTDPPARSTVVAGLVLGNANIEIDMVAYRGK